MTTKVVFAAMLAALGTTALCLVAKKEVKTNVSEASSAQLSAAGPRVPVLVELFTSEGCSSCPPADALISRLQETQPVAGAEVIALSEHVDYWNRLGWRDPYSSAAFSARQNQYASAFNTDEVYTPQMIVGGRVQFTGNDEGKARQAIADALHDARVSVMLGLGSEENQAAFVPVSIQIETASPIAKAGVADVMLAITESGLSSNVTRGENAGRVLNHIAVVRKLSALGEIDPRKPIAFNAHPAVRLAKTWQRNSLKAVVFVQERTSRRVLGVAALPLSK